MPSLSVVGSILVHQKADFLIRIFTNTKPTPIITVSAIFPAHGYRFFGICLQIVDASASTVVPAFKIANFTTDLKTYALLGRIQKTSRKIRITDHVAHGFRFCHLCVACLTSIESYVDILVLAHKSRSGHPGLGWLFGHGISLIVECLDIGQYRGLAKACRGFEALPSYITSCIQSLHFFCIHRSHFHNMAIYLVQSFVDGYVTDVLIDMRPIHSLGFDDSDVKSTARYVFDPSGCRIIALDIGDDENYRFGCKRLGKLYMCPRRVVVGVFDMYPPALHLQRRKHRFGYPIVAAADPRRAVPVFLCFFIFVYRLNGAKTQGGIKKFHFIHISIELLAFLIAT